MDGRDLEHTMDEMDKHGKTSVRQTKKDRKFLLAKDCQDACISAKLQAVGVDVFCFRYCHAVGVRKSVSMRWSAPWKDWTPRGFRKTAGLRRPSLVLCSGQERDLRTSSKDALFGGGHRK